MVLCLVALYYNMILLNVFIPLFIYLLYISSLSLLFTSFFLCNLHMTSSQPHCEHIAASLRHLCDAIAASLRHHGSIRTTSLRPTYGIIVASVRHYHAKGPHGPDINGSLIARFFKKLTPMSSEACKGDLHEVGMNAPPLANSLNNDTRIWYNHAKGLAQKRQECKATCTIR